jgi:hypothetical protein
LLQVCNWFVRTKRSPDESHTADNHVPNCILCHKKSKKGMQKNQKTRRTYRMKTLSPMPQGTGAHWLSQRKRDGEHCWAIVGVCLTLRNSCAMNGLSPSSVGGLQCTSMWGADIHPLIDTHVHAVTTDAGHRPQLPSKPPCTVKNKACDFVVPDNTTRCFSGEQKPAASLRLPVPGPQEVVYATPPGTKLLAAFIRLIGLWPSVIRYP